MNCNCVEELQAALAGSPIITEVAGENIKVECTASAVQITGDMELRSVLHIPFRVTGTGKGYRTAKGKEMPCIASYCPFCGLTAKPTYKVGQYDGIRPLEPESEVMA